MIVIIDKHKDKEIYEYSVDDRYDGYLGLLAEAIETKPPDGCILTQVVDLKTDSILIEIKHK